MDSTISTKDLKSKLDENKSRWSRPSRLNATEKPIFPER